MSTFEYCSIRFLFFIMELQGGDGRGEEGTWTSLQGALQEGGTQARGSPAFPHTLKGQQSEICNLSILSRMTNFAKFLFYFSIIGRTSTVILFFEYRTHLNC